MSRPRMERLIRELLVELGEDPSREGLVDTPPRAAAMLERFSIRGPGPAMPEMPLERLGEPGMVLVRGLELISLCEHHLLPFFGRVHIGCLPRARRCDPDVCSEIVARIAHRPQLQERLTEQIADALFLALDPEGLGVAAECRHLCMMMRGVQKQRSEMQTSSLRGSFREASVRRTFFQNVTRAAPMPF